MNNIDNARDELIKSLERTPIEYVRASIEDPDKVDKFTLLGKLNQIINYINEGKDKGTTITIDGVAQTLLELKGDPQAQLDALNAYCDALDATKVDDVYVNTSINEKSSAMANRLKFNQLLDTAKSTLPTANGLTVTNIYGGHNVVGTTDHQYYHKMYELATIQGHWYYFAPNFSNTKSVYILGHIDGTAFSTNMGKVFEGGSKFDAYIQIERDKTMDFDVQPILVDLTLMFGEGNEPSSVDELYKYIVKGQYYPYVDTPTKEEVNSVGMALSDTVEQKIFQKIGDGTRTNRYRPPSNGYIFVEVNVTQSSYSQVIEMRDKNNAYSQIALPREGTSSYYSILLPVSPYYTYEYYQDNASFNILTSYFIYQKEI